jgi:hypothetical protein
VSIREAARLLGRDPKAIRARIERGTLRWRPAGNHGREVYVTPDMEVRAEDGPGEVPGDDPADAAEAVSLMVQVARLEERLTAREEAAARVEAELRAAVGELRETVAAERARADRLAAELAEARKPALVRLIEALRQR